MPYLSPRFFVNPLPHTLYLHMIHLPSLYLSDCPRNFSLHPPPLYPSLKQILFSPSLLHLHRHPFLLKDNLRLSGQHFALSRSLLSDHLIISGFSVEPHTEGQRTDQKAQNGSPKLGQEKASAWVLWGWWDQSGTEKRLMPNRVGERSWDQMDIISLAFYLSLSSRLQGLDFEMEKK